MLEILRITTGLLINNVELWGGGARFVLVDPIYPVTPSTILSIYYVAGSRLVIEKIGVNKTFSLPSSNLQALGGEEGRAGRKFGKNLGPCLDA